VVREIDEQQGLATILELVADTGRARRATLLEPWRNFLQSETRIRADAAVKATLWARLRNLTTRGLIERVGPAYAVTADGLQYLQELRGGGGPEPDDDQTIRRLLRAQRQKVRDAICDLLSDLDPYAFERLVKQLLEEMGYEDVEVTSPSNDKGVDVVARIELGITSVREVVQVKKRPGGRVQRPTLDQLRGVLHRFRAVRGTIITTGEFSKGTREAAFEPGAPPITLISGDKFIDLLIEYGIGVRKRTLETWEVDPSAFSGEAEDDKLSTE
jgi:restriction system protein